MNDKLIFTDGQSVYITLESKVQLWVKVVLILANIALYMMAVFIIIFGLSENPGRAIFGTLIFSSITYWFATRSMLWNIFGRECMVITPDLLTYYRDFGLFKTPIRNVDLSNGLYLSADYQLQLIKNPMLQLRFVKYCRTMN